jgi:protein-tyrosine phosphatase
MSLRAQRLAVVACLLTGCSRTELPDLGSAGESGTSVSERCSPGQRILVDYVVNARDMGGVPLPDGGSVACGELYRGAPLAGFDAAACAAFSDLAIRTVFDLRTESERTEKPDSPCVMTSTSVVFAPLPIPYNVSPADYIADLNTTDIIAPVFAALGDDTVYPVYFHCTWGRDRTGVLAAVILLALGAKREDILAEYGLSVAGGVGAYPDSLSAALDEIDARGGVESYLAEGGLGPGLIRKAIDVLGKHAIAR